MTTASRTSRRTDGDGGAAAAGSGLDVMLTDAGGGTLRRFLPSASTVKLVGKVAAQPRPFVRHGVELVGELGRVVAGRSEVTPSKGDRRIADPAWEGNPLLKRLCQAYLAASDTTDAVLTDLDLDWREASRLRFVAENVVDALAPSNNPLLNPAALKAVIDTGGRNLVNGGVQLAKDAARLRTPAMVDESAFEVGENVAITPGAVVYRSPVAELMQYAPQTETVHEVPLLIVPPMINKYYVADLAPGRSMIEHYVQNGQQTFTISWRNPGPEHADFDLDTYAGAVLEALDAIEKITGTDRTHVLGLCAGGITASCALAHLAATDRLDEVAGLTLGVTVLDNEQSGAASAFVDPATARMAIADSARRGYLDGRSLAGVFAWLRPNDLVWNYWVNNYLLGKDPPPFDILYWNADTTNLPAGLHRDFVTLAMNNSLIHPGELSVRGTPVDLGAIDVDAYVVAGIADHITPWVNCYRSVHLLGSRPRFVLSTSGHIAALVNPPGNEKSSYQVNDALPEDPDAFLAGATQHRGTWWDDWATWLGERSGDERDAPTALGGEGYEPVGPAPGEYVCAK